ncbi:myosin-10-like isoform X1 [Penaeus chinensis]|uniref:myosin-10-like isoform X1 n=1 Tax=Penaeus chinensis TaxID=139456 RepID=UPI001FB85F17|nr:myosin-10-like isoform X1 [Penaeus chinensis]
MISGLPTSAPATPRPVVRQWTARSVPGAKFPPCSPSSGKAKPKHFSVEGMAGVALALLCAAAWAVSGEAPAGVPQEEDLRPAILFNQLALAQVLELLGGANATAQEQLDRVSSATGAKLEALREDFLQLRSLLDAVSQSISLHVQRDDVTQEGETAEAESMRRALAQDVELEALEQEWGRTSAELQVLRDEARELQADAGADSADVQKLGMEARERTARIHALEQELQKLRIQVNVTEDSNAVLESQREALLAEENNARSRYVIKEVARAQAAQELKVIGAAKDENLQNISLLAGDVDQLKERLSLSERKRTAVRGAIRLLDTTVKDEQEETRRQGNLHCNLGLLGRRKPTQSSPDRAPPSSHSGVRISTRTAGGGDPKIQSREATAARTAAPPASFELAAERGRGGSPAGEP